MMRLDNGAADGEPDSHTVGFGCVKSVENLVRSLRSKADSRIFHAQPYPSPIVPFRFNQQLSGVVVDGAHRIRSVSKQVQDDLLKLDAIAACRREVIRKFLPESYAVFLDLG